MNANDLTNLIGALGKAGLNVTINNHYGSGDIRSGTEVTIHQAAPRARRPYAICAQCGDELWSAWDVSDGGLCRLCAHQALKASNSARFENQQYQALRAAEFERKAELDRIEQAREDYESVPVVDTRTGRVIGSETRRAAPHRTRPYTGGEVEAPIIDARTGEVIGMANPKAGASARR
jgi:hypothetical protein